MSALIQAEAQDRQKPGALHASYTFRAMDSALKWIGCNLDAFFAWFGNAFRHSVCGKAALTVGACIARWTPESVSLRYLRLLVASYDGSINAGTFLGVVLGAGVVLPTELQMLMFLLFLFFYLWWRSGRSESSARSGASQCRFVFGVVLPLIVAFAFTAGAAISSVVPERSIINLALWAFYFSAFLVCLDIAWHGCADGIVWPLLTWVTFSSLVGVYQYLSGWQAVRESWLDERFQDEIVRVVGTFDNPTFFAEMIGLALPVTLALLTRNRHSLDKGILLVYAVIQGAALVLTWSRGAWLGFIASFAALAVMFDKRLLAVGLIGALLAAVAAPPVLVERLLSSFSLEDSSNSYRVFIWRGSLALLRAYLFRGVGLGADSFAQVYPEYMIIQTPAPHAHSTYLQMLIELGLFGFLALMGLLAVCGWRSLSAVFRRRGRGFGRWAAVGMLSGVVAAVGGHLLQGLVEHTWYNPQVTAVFWAWVGTAVGISYRMEAEG